MNKLFLIMFVMAVVASGQAIAQYSTGDTQLNLSLTKIDDDAKLNFSLFKTDLSTSYSVSASTINKWSVEFGFRGGEIYLILELAKILKKSPDEVFKVYSANRTKGWGAISKELGIKPGSPEFHALKNGAGNKAQKSGGKPKTPAKGKGKN